MTKKFIVKGAIFILAYNCEPQLKRVISSLNKKADLLIDKGWESIYFVNNKSKDKTLSTMEDSLKELKNNKFNCAIINNHKNYGLGGSHKVSFYAAQKFKFTHACIFHGDDQADLNDLIDIPEKLYKNDCILGSRFSKGSKLNGYSKTRIIGNLFFNILFSVVLKRKIYDLGSGLNIFSEKVFKDKKIVLFPDGMYFNQSLLIFIAKYYSYEYFPITWSEKDQVSNVKNFKMGIDTLKNLFSEKLKIGLSNRSLYSKFDQYTFDLIK